RAQGANGRLRRDEGPCLAGCRPARRWTSQQRSLLPLPFGPTGVRPERVSSKGQIGGAEMRAVIVYESMYGNTHRIADAIAKGMKPGNEVTVIPVSTVTRELLNGADL